MSRKMKFQAPSLPKEQKLMIALNYVNSEMTLKETAEKYGIAHFQTVWKWVDNFGLKEKMLSLQDEKTTPIMAKKHEDEPLTEQEARDRIRELNTLIDIAEEQGYSIRKKSGAKQ